MSWRDRRIHETIGSRRVQQLRQKHGFGKQGKGCAAQVADDVIVFLPRVGTCTWKSGNRMLQVLP